MSPGSQMLRSAAPATLTGVLDDGAVSFRIEMSDPLPPRYSGGIVTFETRARSPSPSRWLPIRTSIRAAGHATGDETAAPVIELQCPAVSTVFGSISVPVQRKTP